MEPETKALLRDKNWLEEQYRLKSAYAISKELGTTKKSVYDWMEKHGIETRSNAVAQLYSNPSATKLLHDPVWMATQYQTRTANNIADELAVDEATVRKYLRKYGVKIRSSAEAQTGKRLSDEHKEKIGIASKRVWQDPVVRKKTVKAMTGLKRSPEACINMGNAHRGKKSSRYIDGRSYEPYCEKWTKEFRRRIRAFFDHQCVLCGKPQEENGRSLDCHHVEYNKNACCDGKPVHFVALCRSHHSQTSCGDRQRWMNMIHRVIDEIYDGRSYYTQKEYYKE